jgi:zinc and cadmium transporter
MTLVLILTSVIAVSLVSFIGVVFLALNKKMLKSVVLLLLAFSSGSLLGGAFIHLLPESLSLFGESAFVYVLLGILLFFALEKFLYWRHCHEGECDVHAFVYLNLIGDGMHNFIDGMIIAASFIASIPLGISATLAIVLHEIPQEIGDFGILVYGGMERGRALMYNFFSAVTAVFGALFTYFIATSVNLTTYLLPFAAGGFIYIASTDLIPELHKKRDIKSSLMQLVLIVLGVVLMIALKNVFA